MKNDTEICVPGVPRGTPNGIKFKNGSRGTDTDLMVVEVDETQCGGVDPLNITPQLNNGVPHGTLTLFEKIRAAQSILNNKELPK